MASTDLTTAQSMQEIAKAVQSQYKDIVDGIQSKVGAPSSNTIRITQNKKFVLPDGTETAEPIRAVIVGFTSRNVYYAGAYNAGNPTSPDCYAEGDNPATLAPSGDVEMKQADDCKSCPMNMFGSASNGAGKACKNTRVVALLPPDDSGADIMTISVSPSAIKGFDSYISKLASMFGVPPFAVTTEIGFDPKESYAKLTFSNPEPNADFTQFGDRSEEAATAIKANYLMASNDSAPAPQNRGRGRR